VFILLTITPQIWQTAAEGTRLVFIEAGEDEFDMGDDDF
jgi:DNA replication licensing factor MCM7